jgi:hypothetical protein
VYCVLTLAQEPADHLVFCGDGRLGVAARAARGNVVVSEQAEPGRTAVLHRDHRLVDDDRPACQRVRHQDHRPANRLDIPARHRLPQRPQPGPGLAGDEIHAHLVARRAQAASSQKGREPVQHSLVAPDCALGPPSLLLAGGALARALAEASHGQAYDRTLTAKMTVTCVLVACLFLGQGYDMVLATAFGLPGRNLKPGTAVPTGPALSKARVRLGELVIKRLFEIDAPVSDAALGIAARWKGLEVTTIDGTTMELARSDALKPNSARPATAPACCCGSPPMPAPRPAAGSPPPSAATPPPPPAPPRPAGLPATLASRDGGAAGEPVLQL